MRGRSPFEGAKGPPCWQDWERSSRRCSRTNAPRHRRRDAGAGRSAASSRGASRFGTVFGTGGEGDRHARDPDRDRSASRPARPHHAELAKEVQHRDERPPGARAPARRARSSRAAARPRSRTRRCCGFAPNEGDRENAVRRRRAGEQPAARRWRPGSRSGRYWGAVYVTLDHDGNLVARERGVRGQAARRPSCRRRCIPTRRPRRSRRRRSPRATELLQGRSAARQTSPIVSCSARPRQCQVYAGRRPRRTRGAPPGPSRRQRRGMVRPARRRPGPRRHPLQGRGRVGGHTRGQRGRSGAASRTRRCAAARDDPKASAIARHRGQARCVPRQAPPTPGATRARQAKKKFRWTERIAADDLTARVSVEYPEIGRVKKPRREAARRVGPRVQLLQIKGDKASVDVTGDLHIRRLLGGLKSTAVRGEGREAARSCSAAAGFGPRGRDVARMGAIGMADAGKTHVDILKHYYRGTPPAPPLLEAQLHVERRRLRVGWSAAHVPPSSKVEDQRRPR